MPDISQLLAIQDRNDRLPGQYISQLTSTLGDILAQRGQRSFEDTASKFFTANDVTPQSVDQLSSMYPDLPKQVIWKYASQIDTQKTQQGVKDLGASFFDAWGRGGINNFKDVAAFFEKSGASPSIRQAAFPDIIKFMEANANIFKKELTKLAQGEKGFERDENGKLIMVAENPAAEKEKTTLEKAVSEKTHEMNPATGKPYTYAEAYKEVVHPKPEKDQWSEAYEQNVGGKKMMIQKNKATGELRRIGEDKSTTVILGSSGKAPSGYRFSGDGNLEPIPGGPADAKLQTSFNADTASLDSLSSEMDRLAREAKAIKDHPGLGRITGIMGALPNVPGSKGSDVEARLNTLKSQTAFSVLQAMRNNSKTGGALGQVSDKEGELLQNNLSALDKAQSPKAFQDAMQRIIDFTEASKTRLQKAYNQKWGGQSGSTQTLPRDGRVKVKSPSGQIGTIPANQLSDAINQGFKRVE